MEILTFLRRYAIIRPEVEYFALLTNWTKTPLNEM